MLWNKTLLKWEEPRFAQNYIARHLQIRDYIKPFGKAAIKLFLGSYIVIWLFGWFSPRHNSNPILSFDLLIIASVLTGFYFLIWLMTLWGSKVSKPQVRLREKNLTYTSVEGHFVLPYKKMESFSIVKANIEENEYFVLNVRDWNGNESFIEIEPKINNELIIEILKSKNVKIKTSLLYPS